MNRKIVPSDSCLNYWLDSMGITEVPTSYQVLCGLSAIGACLRRQAFVDDEKFKIFPNMSVLLIGPSGIGKDVSIDAAREVVKRVGVTPIIRGKTIEYLKERLIKCNPMAACFTPAAEISAFLGKKDYQQGIVAELTDLMSTGSEVDVSTKGEGEQVILNPTVTIQAGTTEAWLKNLPDGSLDGGFLPRFVITVEQYGIRHVPWVKYSTDHNDRIVAQVGAATFVEEVHNIVHRFTHAREIVPTSDAIDFYTNWYRNRFKYFSPSVEAYANRSRGLMHKLAMLMAITRKNNYMEEVDYQFGSDVIWEVANSIEGVLGSSKGKEKRKV